MVDIEKLEESYQKERKVAFLPQMWAACPYNRLSESRRRLISADYICRTLYNTKFRYHSEKELQLGVGLVLTSLQIEFKPEYSLAPRDRIDFIILDGSGIGIECKADDSHGGTSLAAVTRQLHRYSQASEIKELILLTSMSKHKHLPDTMNIKPIYVVHLLLSFL